MNDNYYILGGLLVIVILFAITDFTPIDSAIPPTPAFKSINGTAGSITATNYKGNLGLIEGSNITFTFDDILKKLTISATGSGGGENNTASNIGLGEDIFKQKAGVDLEFKGIAVNGDLSISSNDTDITISYIDPISGSGNATVLDELGDVIITTPSYPSILFYDGSEWINKIFSINNQTVSPNTYIAGINNLTGIITTATITAGSGNATVLDELGDVIITTPSNTHILQHNGNQFVNKAFSINTQSASNDIFITGINNATGTITTNTFSVNSLTCSGTDKISSIDNVTGTVTCSTDQTGGGTARESAVAIWTVDATKTNIGTAYVNVYTTGLGDLLRIDTNGKTTASLIIDWTKIGTGTQSCVIRSNTNPAIELISFANVVSGLNTNATFDIPTNAENLIDNFKPMCKSTTAGDDPVWLTGQVLLR